MSKEKEMPADIVKVITMLKLDNGVEIDFEEMTSKQKEAYIEFAIYLAAPKIAKLLSKDKSINGVQESQFKHPVDETFFNYPSMLNVKQAVGSNHSDKK